MTVQFILSCMPKTGTAIDAVWQRGVLSNFGFGTSEVADLVSEAARENIASFACQDVGFLC